MTSESYSELMIVLLLVAVAVFLFDLYYWMRHKERSVSEKKHGLEIDIALFCISWLVLFVLNNHTFVPYNNYSYLSESLLNGRLDTPTLPLYLESIELGGKIYMHFAPGVSFLLMPFVALFGVQGVNYAYIGITLGAANTALFYRLLVQMNVGTTLRERLWCTAFCTFGTVHCFLAAISHSWFIGHVSSWFFLFAAMVLTTKPYQKRWVRCLSLFFGGLLFGLAVCCRLSNLLGAGFFIAYLFLFTEKKNWIRYGLCFMVGAAIFGGIYMGMNYVRFGTIMDESYNLTHLKDLFKPLYYFMQEYFTEASDQMAFLHAVEKTDWANAFPTTADQLAFLEFLQRNAAEGWNYCQNIPTAPISNASAEEIEAAFHAVVTASFPKVGGALSIDNARNNLHSIFLLMPEFSKNAPHVIPTLSGVSLTAISPALYFCFVPLWTKRKEPFVWVLFASVITCAIPFVLNYGNGFAQFGMRYAMDFLPYMILLACMGLTHGKFRPWKSAILLFCICANVWGPIYWNCFYL